MNCCAASPDWSASVPLAVCQRQRCKRTSHGQHTLGLFTVIGAKIIGTALVARIYTLTQGSLLKILWFATLHGKFTAFKYKVYSFIKATPIYQSAHELKVKVKKFVQGRGKAFWRRRWEAARRFARAETITKDRNRPIGHGRPVSKELDAEEESLVSEGLLRLPIQKKANDFLELPTSEVSLDQIRATLRAERDEE
jgi:transposase